MNDDELFENMKNQIKSWSISRGEHKSNISALRILKILTRIKDHLVERTHSTETQASARILWCNGNPSHRRVASSIPQKTVECWLIRSFVRSVSRFYQLFYR